MAVSMNTQVTDEQILSNLQGAGLYVMSPLIGWGGGEPQL